LAVDVEAVEDIITREVWQLKLEGAFNFFEGELREALTVKGKRDDRANGELDDVFIALAGDHARTALGRGPVIVGTRLHIVVAEPEWLFEVGHDRFLRLAHVALDEDDYREAAVGRDNLASKSEILFMMNTVLQGSTMATITWSTLNCRMPWKKELKSNYESRLSIPLW
jgi:hypothetical protein